MIDVMMALAKRKERLVARRHEVFSTYLRETDAIDAELKEVDSAIRKVNEAIQDYLCPVCNGTGEMRVCDAAGQMESIFCTECHGTGIKT